MVVIIIQQQPLHKKTTTYSALNLSTVVYRKRNRQHCCKIIGSKETYHNLKQTNHLGKQYLELGIALSDVTLEGCSACEVSSPE